MSGTVPGMTVALSQPRDAAMVETWQPPDGRRLLQLALAATWLVDAILQFQPFMFTRMFGSEVLSPTAVGNPALVAGPIRWAAREITTHASEANAVFCVLQLLIALGIAWRPTVKVALSVSIVWSLSVWWLGEGLGGVLTGNVNPVSGAPGPAVLYALLAILLWPTVSTPMADPPRSVAEQPLGPTTARVLWLVLWLSLAYFALLPASRAAGGLSRMIAPMASGQPRWLARIDLHMASAIAGHGVAVSAALAVVLGLVGIGVLLPRALVRVVIVVAAGIALTIWVIGQAFGGVFTGAATDPGSGPVLLLLAAAYWPPGAAATSGQGP